VESLNAYCCCGLRLLLNAREELDLVNRTLLVAMSVELPTQPLSFSAAASSQGIIIIIIIIIIINFRSHHVFLVDSEAAEPAGCSIFCSAANSRQGRMSLLLRTFYHSRTSKSYCKTSKSRRSPKAGKEAKERNCKIKNCKPGRNTHHPHKGRNHQTIAP
jgi:hypothetical protein